MLPPREREWCGGEDEHSLLPKRGKFAGPRVFQLSSRALLQIYPATKRGEMGYVMREDQTSCNDEAV